MIGQVWDGTLPKVKLPPLLLELVVILGETGKICDTPVDTTLAFQVQHTISLDGKTKGSTLINTIPTALQHTVTVGTEVMVNTPPTESSSPLYLS